MKKVLIISVVVLALSLFVGSIAMAGFQCSVCGSNSHGSLWHDSDKDGVPDR